MSAELAQGLTGEWLVVSIWGEPVDPHVPRSVVFETATMAGQVGSIASVVATSSTMP